LPEEREAGAAIKIVGIGSTHARKAKTATWNCEVREVTQRYRGLSSGDSWLTPDNPPRRGHAGLQKNAPAFDRGILHSIF
jgi:hypothetical protein